ncbi:MAG: ComEA family DNA-binding protein [Bacteroides sp.]
MSLELAKSIAVQKNSVVLLLFWFCGGVGCCYAQLSPESLVEQYAVFNDDLEGSEALLEVWQEYLAHPFDLNSVSYTQLLSLPFLTVAEGEAIWQYRKRYQSFSSIYDLGWIEGISQERAKFLSNFFFVGEPPSVHSFELLQQLGYRSQLEKKKKKIGSPLFLETRALYSLGEIWRTGIRGRKLAGEPFGGKHSPLGYGDNTFFVEYTPVHRGFLRAVVGNYMLSSGYGLTYSTGANYQLFAGGHSKQGAKLIPRGTLLSANSGLPLGGALSFRFAERVLWTVSGSYRGVHATYKEQDGVRYLRSVDIGGVFDTETRQRWRYSTRETLVHTDLHYRDTHFAGGIVGVFDRFRNPFLLPTSQNGGLPELRVQTNLRVGAYFEYSSKIFLLWGEYTLGNTLRIPRVGLQGSAMLLGTEYRGLAEHLFSAEFYYYGKENVERYQQNYSFRSQARNRLGVNIYYTYWLPTGGKLLGYYSAFRDLEYGAKLISHPPDQELMLASEVSCGNGVLHCRYNFRIRSNNNLGIRGIQYNYRHRILGRYTYPLNRVFSLHTQLQMVLGNQKQSSKFARVGVAGFQDVRYTWRGFRVVLRLGAHSLEKSATTLSSYDPSLRYVYARHILQGLGIRCALLLRWSFARWWMLGAQAGVSYILRGEKKGFTGQGIRLQLSFAI